MRGCPSKSHRVLFSDLQGGVMNPRFVVVAIAACSAVACAGATQSSSSTRSANADSLAILEAAGAFSAAYMRGDAAAMAALYTDDAVIFPEGTAAIEGRPAIERYWTL